ncbi:hypothetical protein RCL1_004437 [Eukaryota sp. TZLM3-RCL]
MKKIQNYSASEVYKLAPLRLVLMSATIDTSVFINSKLWKTPKIVTVPSKVYPICVHFSRVTSTEYVKTAYQKVKQIHEKLPSGTILVFVSGADECHQLCRLLNRSLSKKAINQNDCNQGSRDTVKNTAQNDDEYFDQFDHDSDVEFDPQSINDIDSDYDLDELIEDEEQQVFLNCNDENSENSFELDKIKSLLVQESALLSSETAQKSNDFDLLALPLYSSLPRSQQDLVFQSQTNEEANTKRLIIVATNVAEASLTIPNVKYVIDTGRVKRKSFHPLTGASQFRIGLTSQASATQRAGRTGRTCPGHVFRLYSSAVYNDTMPREEVPGILTCQVDSIVLLLKCLGIDYLEKFPWVTAPDINQIQEASRLLEMLGATEGGKITALGKLMVKFPVSCRFSKMIIAAQRMNILGEILLAVAVLSVDNLFYPVPILQNSEENISNNSNSFSNSLGDIHGLINLFKEYVNQSIYNIHSFISEHRINSQAIKTAVDLKNQLSEISASIFKLDKQSICLISELNSKSNELISKCVLTSFFDKIAGKFKTGNNYSSPCIPPTKDSQGNETQILLKVSNTSLLYGNSFPDFLMFLSLTNRDSVNKKGELFMRMPLVCAVQLEWVQELFLPIKNGNYNNPLLEKSVFSLTKKQNIKPIFRISPPSSVPTPSYHQNFDTVLCNVSCEFGYYNRWKLNDLLLPLYLFDHTHAIRVFCFALLSGKVFPELGNFVPFLIFPPSVVLRPTTNTKISSLIKVMNLLSIISKKDLIKIWKKQPGFLLSHYLQIIHTDKHETIRQLWPPIKND